MGGVDIGRRRAASPPWPGLVPVRAGLVIDFCISPIRTGNSTYPEKYTVLTNFCACIIFHLSRKVREFSLQSGNLLKVAVMYGLVFGNKRSDMQITEYFVT